MAGRKQRDLRATFGAKVRQARSERGWSQTFLAEQLGTRGSTVAAWEKGGGAGEAYVLALELLFEQERGALGWILGYADPPERWSVEDAIDADPKIAVDHKRILHAHLREVRKITTEREP